MLRQEAVVPEMYFLIKELQKDPLFQNHILVGGTALTLQLGHRTSTDIDLFTTKSQNALALINYFKKKYDKTEIEIAKNDFIRIYVNKIKIELVEYDEKFIEEPKKDDGIIFASINDIAAMKLSAIMTRTEPRDFIDIAYLLKEMSLNKMFDLYKEKNDALSSLYIKRTLLVKSKNIQEDEWLEGGIKMLRNDIELKNIPSFIEKEIEKYNKIITNNKVPKSNKINSKPFTRNITIKIDTNTDNFIKSTKKYNNPSEIIKSLFTHIANDRKLFEDIITNNNPSNQMEYAKGSFEVLSEACENIIHSIKDENNTKDYIDKFTSMQNLYIQMEDAFKYFPPGDFNDGMYVASSGLSKALEKVILLIKEGG
jgi:hypothetical protein